MKKIVLLYAQIYWIDMNHCLTNILSRANEFTIIFDALKTSVNEYINIFLCCKSSTNERLNIFKYFKNIFLQGKILRPYFYILSKKNLPFL